MNGLEQLLLEVKELRTKGDNQAAGVLLTPAIDVACEQHDPRAADLLNERGIVRRMQQRYDDAFGDYQKAFEVSISNEQKAAALINQADVYRVARNDNSHAHTSLDEALTYAGNGTLLHAKAVDQRGLVFFGEKQYDHAIASFKRAREFCEHLLETNADDKDVQNRFTQAVLHLGTAYVWMKDPAKVDEAYECLNTSLRTFRKLGDVNGMTNAVMTLGKIAAIKKDYAQAITQYEQALVTMTGIADTRAVTVLNLYLAQAHFALENNQQGVTYLQRFTEGVLRDEITPNDRKVLQEEFAAVADRYDNNMPLKVENFDQIRALFD